MLGAEGYAVTAKSTDAEKAAAASIWSFLLPMTKI